MDINININNIKRCRASSRRPSRPKNLLCHTGSICPRCFHWSPLCWELSLATSRICLRGVFGWWSMSLWGWLTPRTGSGQNLRLWIYFCPEISYCPWRFYPGRVGCTYPPRIYCPIAPYFLSSAYRVRKGWSWYLPQAGQNIYWGGHFSSGH